MGRAVKLLSALAVTAALSLVSAVAHAAEPKSTTIHTPKGHAVHVVSDDGQVPSSAALKIVDDYLAEIAAKPQPTPQG
jgi:hypothetical protein